MLDGLRHQIAPTNASDGKADQIAAQAKEDMRDPADRMADKSQPVMRDMAIGKAEQTQQHQYHSG